MGWTVSVSPVGDHKPLLVAEPRGHRAADEEQDQAEVADEGRHLDPPIPIAVDVLRSAVLGGPDPEPAAAQRSLEGRRIEAGLDTNPIGQLRIEVGFRLDHPDLGRGRATGEAFDRSCR